MMENNSSENNDTNSQCRLRCTICDSLSSNNRPDYLQCLNPLLTQSFICSNCVSCIFPFNHYCDDSEFRWNMFSFFHLNENINIDKIQDLKIDPFSLNTGFDNKIQDYCSINDDNREIPLFLAASTDRQIPI